MSSVITCEPGHQEHELLWALTARRSISSAAKWAADRRGTERTGLPPGGCARCTHSAQWHAYPGNPVARCARALPRSLTLQLRNACTGHGHRHRHRRGGHRQRTLAYLRVHGLDHKQSTKPAPVPEGTQRRRSMRRRSGASLVGAPGSGVQQWPQCMASAAQCSVTRVVTIAQCPNKVRPC